MQKRPLKFSDITNQYSPIMFGFAAQLYVIVSTSLYYLLEHEFMQHLGLTRQQLITYYSLFSIILLFCIRHQTWTTPIVIEDALIVIFFWLLLGNLIYIDCQCCSSSSDPDSLNCFWQNNQLFYSMLCVSLMFISFLFNATNYYLSIIIKVIGIGLLIFVPVVPITCNQFLLQTIDINTIKLTLFIIMWFIFRRLRLIEIVISNEYMKSIAILKSYSNYKTIFEPPPPTKTTTKKVYMNDSNNPVVDHLHTSQMMMDYTIPRNLFNELLRINNLIMTKKHQWSTTTSENKQHNLLSFSRQVENFSDLYKIHRKYNDDKYFTWKNRYYDKQLLFILDLASTIWILTVCPFYLFFITIQFVILLYNISESSSELRSVVKAVKSMDFWWSHQHQQQRPTTS
jgi:hypothetical protein